MKKLFLSSAALFLLGSSYCAGQAAGQRLSASQAPAGQAPPSSAAASLPQEIEQVVVGLTCRNNGEARRLEVLPKEKGCSLRYAKSAKGKASVIANARHGVEFCREKLSRLRGRLESAGYVCE